MDSLQLDSLTDGWTEMDAENQRQVVEVTRRQEGDTISANFKPVHDAFRDAGRLYISCIRWEEEEEGKEEARFYITSVDMIRLYSFLLGVTFTLGELNRIRRRLEASKPTAISKLKGPHTAFFGRLVSYQDPQPWNVKKDIKVFKWETISTSTIKQFRVFVGSELRTHRESGF